MIIDFHTHIFPPEVINNRARYLAGDATFAELYSSPKATLATAEALLKSMDEAGIDVSVALGFAWVDIDACRLHNDYLIEAKAKSGGRIVPFCTLPLAADVESIDAEGRRCASGGARGFGELRPENLGFDVTGQEGDSLAQLARELGTTLLFHVSEPVGHAYAGKQGLSLAEFYDFVRAHPDVRVVGAHWGGGLPFYAQMPEVKQAFSNLRVDTAASSLLYGDDIYETVCRLTGTESVLFGSDFPLLSQKRSRRRIDESGLDEASKAMVLGGNAAALLGLT